MEANNDEVDNVVFKGGPMDGKVLVITKGINRVDFPVAEKGGFGRISYYSTGRVEDGEIVFEL